MLGLDLQFCQGPVPESALIPPRSGDCGAVASFTGVVRHDRQATSLRQITALFYEFHATLGQVVFKEIGQRVLGTLGAEGALFIRHATGQVRVGEVVIVIHVSARRRAMALAGCAAAINLVKRELPVWKEERYNDGHRQWSKGS